MVEAYGRHVGGGSMRTGCVGMKVIGTWFCSAPLKISIPQRENYMYSSEMGEK